VTLKLICKFKLSWMRRSLHANKLAAQLLQVEVVDVPAHSPTAPPAVPPKITEFVPVPKVELETRSAVMDVTTRPAPKL
jgi:hypothetical protein